MHRHPAQRPASSSPADQPGRAPVVPLPSWASDGGGPPNGRPARHVLEDAVPPDPGLPILVPRLPEDAQRIAPPLASMPLASTPADAGRRAPQERANGPRHPRVSEASPLLYPMGPSQPEPVKGGHWKLLFLVFFFLSWLIAAAAVLFLYMDRYLFV